MPNELERLHGNAEENQVEICEKHLPDGLKGLYCDGHIRLEKALTQSEKTCVLAEELGHHHTSYGIIFNQHNLAAVKQEARARRWAYDRLLRIDDLIAAYEAGISSRAELAEYLNLTEDFIAQALTYFKTVNGSHLSRKGYIITFDPLLICKPLNNDE